MADEPQNDKPGVDEMIDALREGGEVDSEGTFTLDRAQARERLRDFQLAEPSWYLLLLIQAAVRQEATRIVVDNDVRRIRLTFDGRPFTRRDVVTLYDDLFSDRAGGQRNGRHELALGLNAALRLDPGELRVRSGDGSRGIELVLTPGREERYEEHEMEVEGTSIDVDLRALDGNLLERSLADAEGTHPEEALLRERCQYSPVEVALRIESEELSISRGPRLAGAHARTPVKGAGVTGEVGFRADTSAPAELHVVLDGVWSTTHPLPSAPGGFLAVVSCDGLRKDLSQFEVVQDAVYDELLAAVDTARDNALSVLCDHADELQQQRELLPDWIREGLKHAVFRFGSRDNFEGAGASSLARRLAATPLWTVMPTQRSRGGMRSLRQVLSRIAEGIKLTTYGVDDRISRLDRFRGRLKQLDRLCIQTRSPAEVRFFHTLLKDDWDPLEDLAEFPDAPEESVEAQPLASPAMTAKALLFAFALIVVVITSVSVGLCGRY